MKTSIVDLHKVNHHRPPFDVYIGRAVRYTEFTKNSIWYNPYFAKNYEPDHIQDCLRDYEIYIREKIKQDPVKYNLRELVGKKLGCWCLTTDNFDEPMRCHGQILLKLIKELGLE
jgi:hypothetical protein